MSKKKKKNDEGHLKRLLKLKRQSNAYEIIAR